MRLSALIASYESGAHALACARSLRAEWTRLARAPDALEIVVCDDASPTEQGSWLAALEREGCRVLRRGQRGGYAAAIETALAATRGAPDDVVAVLNADLYFPAGSLEPCLRALARDAGLGAVAPRTCAEPLCVLELPPQQLPTPAGELAALLAGLDDACARDLAQRRTRAALAHWSARGLCETRMLSGACVFLTRAWIARLDTLLDVRFPLYFEDTDLCRRLSAAGARLAVCREAAVVHFWARSTGLGAHFEARAAARFAASRRLYYERWHGPEERDALAAGEALFGARGRPQARLHDFAELGVVDVCPRLELARAGAFLVEVGLAPDLGLAAGSLGQGAAWQLGPRGWEWLHAARYYVRALALPELELLGAWTFEKRCAPRDDPQALLEEARAREPVA